MSTNPPKRGLGRGFDALLPTDVDTAALAGVASSDTMRQISPKDIAANPHQPRSHFDKDKLQELANSIKEHGILQPLLVIEKGGAYELVAGERRLRAAKLAGLATVPAIVRSFDAQQKLEIALIENIQRAELNPMETAMAYRKLADEFNLTGEQISKRVGQARSTVSNIVRLLNLPAEVQQLVAAGQLSEGHARQVLAIEGIQNQIEAAQLIIKNGWTARQAEEFVRAHKTSNAAPVAKTAEKVSNTNEITEALQSHLNTKVTLQRTANGGKLVIEYKNDDDLGRIASILKPQG